MADLDRSGVMWRKSIRSPETGGNCVEVATVDGAIAVRDSKAPDQPALSFQLTAWAAFVSQIKQSEANLS